MIAVHIKNFMSPELVEYLRNYIYLTKKVYETTNETKHLEGDGQKPDAKFVSYGDRALDNLFETHLPKIQDAWDNKLYPAYTYTRLYNKGEGLSMHRDRIASDVTCSVKLDGTPWPFTVRTENPKGSTDYELDIGDALVFNGNKYTHGHWKETTVEQLHLLMICTEYEDQIYDKRPHLGLPPETREGKPNHDYKDEYYGHDPETNFLKSY
tara:strand:- start:1131 stop:1760 length:630 start_codon:yes stop_codon:yes gene_type:complete